MGKGGKFLVASVRCLLGGDAWCVPGGNVQNALLYIAKSIQFLFWYYFI